MVKIGSINGDIKFSQIYEDEQGIICLEERKKSVMFTIATKSY